MKEGFYIRFVPMKNEELIYFYNGCSLFFLDNLSSLCLVGGRIQYVKINDDNLFWQLSATTKPYKKLGFEYLGGL